ncbi:MAG: alpha/beta hydrolase [Cyanobacteria bacterium P01_F01_bin.150]
MTAFCAGWQHLFVETNRIRLHCVTQGEGELVILLHGFPEFWYSWRHQIPVLARHFKVVVPDLRGYNDSDKPLSGYDLDTLSHDIKGLMKSLGYAKAHVVGHDWGGAIAWHLAQTFPQSVQRLAILNAPHPQRFMQEILGNLDQLRRSWYVLAFQVPTLPEWLLRSNLQNFLKNMLQDQAIRKGAFTREDTAIYQAALAKPGALSSAIAHYRHLLLPQNWGRHLTQNLPVTAPTLVLWGDDDKLLSHRFTEGLEKIIAAPFRLKRIPQCGHWIQQEVPQTVNRELIKFLCHSST